jgi:pilus assembly protein CpaF
MSVELGALAALLADDDVSDIMVNATGGVWVERGGVLEPVELVLSEQAMALLIERMVGPIGRRVDRAAPFADGRLADGSRFHVVVPPAAVDGPHVTIRRFRARRVTLDELAEPPVARLLRRIVGERCNVLVSGATGAGKTTLLNALVAHAAPSERIVTIEDAAELQLAARHVVRLEARPGNAEGAGEIPLRSLVRNALRMRPDRLVVGEVRGDETIDMLQAMNTGHDGSLSTCHANSALDALRRVETMAVAAAPSLPLRALRELIAASLDIVVHVERTTSGARRVAQVCEVQPPGDGPWQVRVLAERAVLRGDVCRGRRVEVRP